LDVQTGWCYYPPTCGWLPRQATFGLQWFGTPTYHLPTHEHTLFTTYGLYHLYTPFFHYRYHYFTRRYHALYSDRLLPHTALPCSRIPEYGCSTLPHCATRALPSACLGLRTAANTWRTPPSTTAPAHYLFCYGLRLRDFHLFAGLAPPLTPRCYRAFGLPVYACAVLAHTMPRYFHHRLIPNTCHRLISWTFADTPLPWLQIKTPMGSLTSPACNAPSSVPWTGSPTAGLIV